MLFRQEILQGIAAGDVTLAFRRWRKAPPAAGATLRTPIGVLSLDRVETIDESGITDEDARKSGFPSRDALLSSLRAGGTLYRIELRHIGEDPRVGLRQTRIARPEDAADLLERLGRLDRRVEGGWTAALLRLVNANAGLPAGDLAVLAGFEKMELKRRMRQLKELGLTESLTPGYRLSPRGEDLLAWLPRA